MTLLADDNAEILTEADRYQLRHEIGLEVTGGHVDHVITYMQYSVCGDLTSDAHVNPGI
jgi:hypothetical protein